MLFLKVLRRRMTIFIGISSAKSTGGMLQQTSSSWKSRGEYWEKEKEKEPSTPHKEKALLLGGGWQRDICKKSTKSFNISTITHWICITVHWASTTEEEKSYRTLHSFKVKLEMLSTEKTLRKQDIIDALLCLPQRPEWQPETEVPRSKTALLGANHYS